MELRVSKFVAILWLLKCVLGDGTILKCIVQDLETIIIKCPRRHVIFNPSMVGVVTTDQTCSRSRAYCSGLPRSLEKQLYNCHWRKQCTVTFRKNDTISCPQKDERIDFVVVEQPYCIPKNSLIDVRGKELSTIKKKLGVIRSHKHYPKLQRRQPHSQRIIVNIRPDYTLYMSLRRPAECLNKKDITLRRLKNGKLFLVTDAFKEKLVFHGNDTDSLELTIKKTGADQTCRRGFILPFASFRTKSVTVLMEWPESSFSVIRDLEWIFEVRAVIEQCIVDATGQAVLTCNGDEVIYSPEFSVAAYTRYEPTCISGKYPCGGHTPMTLVQRNMCFWKNSCQVKWNGQIPILVSAVPSCIGYAASVIGMYGHRCVPKDQIFDMCSNCSKMINADWGIIRSHSSYPWFFSRNMKYSKRIIQIGQGHKLLLIVQDINLDPDRRDKFSLVHKFIEASDVSGSELPVIKQERRIVMETKEAVPGVSVEIKGGVLDVNFRPYRRTKGGRGFVLVFKKYKIDPDKKPIDDNQLAKEGIPVSDVAKPLVTDAAKRPVSDVAKPLVTDAAKRPVSDAAKPVRLRMNRRRCSGGRRRRRKGRACRPRVWTDYFTKLE